MNAEKSSSESQPAPDPANDKDFTSSAPLPQKRNSFKNITLVILSIILLIGGVSAGWYWYYFHGSAFSPVVLSQQEQHIIDEKLELAGGDAIFSASDVIEPNNKPIVVRVDDPRTIIFTEREINAVLHHNTDLADKLYIDLKNDAIVAKVVYPVQEDVAVLGGKTLRANVTMQVFLDDNGQLQIALGDVTVSGIPLPNAWLFDAKGKNLVDLDSGPDGTGLLKRIADGIADFKVEKGQIRIKLNE